MTLIQRLYENGTLGWALIALLVASFFFVLWYWL